MTCTKEELELVAMALRYAKNEWVLADGVIHSDQWAEAFAFARFPPEDLERDQAKDIIHKWELDGVDWRAFAERCRRDGDRDRELDYAELAHVNKLLRKQ